MGDSKVSQFDNIYFGISNHIGKLRMAVNGIGWKAAKIEKLHTIKSDEMSRFYWMRSIKQYELSIATKDGNVTRFLNFQRDDFETLKEIIKSYYKQNIEVREMSLKGWNWGKAEFEGADLVFNVEEKPMFEIPLNQVANTNLVGKNEVSIEFAQPEDPETSKSKSNDMDELVEVRFYIPTTAKSKEKKDNEDNSDKGSDEEQSEEDEQTQNAAELFYQSIKSRADLTTSGETICMFPDTLLLLPRGRYDIDMFSTFLRLRGKTYDYKLLYNQVLNLFLLPKPDDTLVMFILEIDPPLRQGQTRYPFLVLQFNKDEELEMDLTFDDELNQKNFNGKLEKHYDAPKHEVVSNVFRAITKRKIALPGTYRSHHGAFAFKASFKANEGLMYPLEKCIIFAPKPVVLIPLSEIASIMFSRVGGPSSAGSRTFDMKINLKSGVNHPFSSVNREEYPYIETYLKSKKIKVIDEAQEESLLFKDLGDDSDDSDIVAKEIRNSAGEEDDEESEDEDFIGGSSSSESEVTDDDDDVADDVDDESPAKKQKK